MRKQWNMIIWFGMKPLGIYLYKLMILGRDLINGNTYTVESHLYGNVAKTGCYHSTKVYRQDAIQG